MRFPPDQNGKTERVAEPGTEAFERLVALLNYPMFVGKILDRFRFGDHVGHLLEPVDGKPPHELAHLVSFGDVRHLRPGHEA
jgi:hypothetical protein